MRTKNCKVEVKKVIGTAPNGRQIRKSFYGRTEREANAKYLEFMRDTHPTEENGKENGFTFEKWAKNWLTIYKKGDVKPTTFLSTYQRPCNMYIIPYFKNYNIQDIKQIDLKKFLLSVQHLSQSYISKIIICLNGIFESAIDNDIIAKNPCRRLTCKSKQSKQDKRVYDQESVDLLCNVEQKYALLVNILLKMGLRCSELCGLKWSDIDIDAGKMHICRALTSESNKVYIGETKTKTSKRTLPIPKDLLKKLKKAPKDTEFVAMVNGRNITPSHFNERYLEFFYNTAKVPKEKRLTAHELRHTCGTLLYEKTKDIYFVSKFLGHSDIGITTKIYVHSEMNEDKIHI